MTNGFRVISFYDSRAGKQRYRAKCTECWTVDRGTIRRPHGTFRRHSEMQRWMDSHEHQFTDRADAEHKLEARRRNRAAKNAAEGAKWLRRWFVTPTPERTERKASEDAATVADQRALDELFARQREEFARLSNAVQD